MNEFLIMVALWCGQPINPTSKIGYTGISIRPEEVRACRKKVIKECLQTFLGHGARSMNVEIVVCMLKATE